MLRPERIDAIPTATLDAFAVLDSRLRGIAAKALTHPETVDKGAVLSDMLAAGAGERRAIERAVSQSFVLASREALSADEARYAAARTAGLIADYVPLAKSYTLQAVLDAGVATALDMTNLVRTAAVQAVNAEFTAALDSAMLSVTLGTQSPDAAIRAAVRSIAQTETAITYATADGMVRSSVYSAVRRAVLTGANQTTLRMQEARMAEVGATWVEVSAHLGARPEHAEWQGQVMPFDELPERTGYGEGDGLGGWNCRHSWMPYFPGIMEPTDWGFDADDEERNEELYALSQRQRLAERNIRKYQGRVNIYTAAGDKDGKAQSKALADKWRREADAVAAQRGGVRRRNREIGGL